MQTKEQEVIVNTGPAPGETWFRATFASRLNVAFPFAPCGISIGTVTLVKVDVTPDGKQAQLTFLLRGAR